MWLGCDGPGTSVKHSPLQAFLRGALLLLPQQDQMRALLSRYRISLDKVAAKLQSCLEERDEMRRRATEALKAKEAVTALTPRGMLFRGQG